MKATWKKNRDGDGFILRITLEKTDKDVNSGDKVSVRRKDGVVRQETVDRVLWAGPSNDDDKADGDLIVFATAVEREKKPKISARAMAKAEPKAKAEKPTEAPEAEDDIPF